LGNLRKRKRGKKLGMRERKIDDERQASGNEF